MSSFNDGDAAKKAGPSITRLIIYSGEVVDAIQTVVNGTTELPRHGGGSGGRNEIFLDSGEYITGIEGITGQYFGAKHIANLKIGTDKRVIGSFGTGSNLTGGQPFIKKAKGEVIAFSGYSTVHTDSTEFLTELDIIEK
jgi:hypothetical protein